MSIVTRTSITDADTGEKREAFSFKFGKPATQADVEALYEFLVSKSPPGLLKIARVKLADLDGYPEHASAARAIETGEHFAALGQWDRVSGAVSDFSACYERAIRRREIRQHRKPLVAGGKKSAETRADRVAPRNADIRVRFELLRAGGMQPHEAKGTCAAEWKLSKPQIRRILGPNE